MKMANLGQKMEREMAEQPALLNRVCNNYYNSLLPYLKDQKYEMILLAARGSSDNAALYARYLFEIHLGIPVSLAAPSVITRFHSKMSYPKCLAIGISQSGAAPDVSEVIAYMREQGHATLGITNTADSRLQKEAEHTLLLDAGEETSIAATKTYSASLLALAQVVRALGGDLPDPSTHLPTEKWYEHVKQVAEEKVGEVVRCSPTFCLGRSYTFCTAVETALKLMECALLSAKSYSTADFEHGPKALANHGTACVVYGSVPEGLAETGTSIIHAPDCGEGPYAPLSNIIFGQWLALLSARARGLDPDTAHNLSKVTKTL